MNASGSSRGARGGSLQQPPRPSVQQPTQATTQSSYQHGQDDHIEDDEFSRAEFEEQLLRRAATGGAGLNPRPDPSKKQICRVSVDMSLYFLQEDQPVKFNPSGKYNLNFIDWDNEWERVFEYQSLNYNPSEQGAPIDGMDIQTFE